MSWVEDYEFLDALILGQSSPEEAYRRFDELSARNHACGAVLQLKCRGLQVPGILTLCGEALRTFRTCSTCDIQADGVDSFMMPVLYAFTLLHGRERTLNQLVRISRHRPPFSNVDAESNLSSLVNLDATGSWD
eukprot:3672174-Amphidinium_carterae.1